MKTGWRTITFTSLSLILDLRLLLLFHIGDGDKKDWPFFCWCSITQLELALDRECTQHTPP